MTNQINHEINHKFTLCGGRRCCPVVEILGNLTTITDDYGNTVRMETDQLKLLVEEGNKIFEK